MARGRYMNRAGTSGLGKVIKSLIDLVLLWVLMFVFEEIIDVVDDYVNSSGKFGEAVTLLDALPEIIGLIASVFLVMDVIKGFRQLRA